jgi:hypothetical protein
MYGGFYGRLEKTGKQKILNINFIFLLNSVKIARGKSQWGVMTHLRERSLENINQTQVT